MFISYSCRQRLFLAVAAVSVAGLTPTVFGQSLPGQPTVEKWFADPNAANSIMNWDPATDPDVAFNRATIPLAPRLGNVVNVNPNAKTNQGGVTSLVAFNHENSSYSQGWASQNLYAPTYYQYTNTLVYWGGSAGTGSILCPNGTIIDAAHRNGVRVLGNVFLAPVVYGGTMNEVNAFLAQRPDGSYPVADKMIAAAQTYGFDGWFLNQETSGGNSSTATKMVGFINYMRAKAPNLHIQWYDAMNESGGVGWQGQLNSNNDAFFDSTPAANTGKVSDSMFLDFRWNSSNANLTTSATNARNLGRSQYELFSGVDFESRGYAMAGDVDRVFGSGGNHLTSLGIYRPEYTYNNSNKIDRNDFYNRDNIFWVGQNGDASNTTTSQAWKGIANYVAPQSTVKGDTFVTNFNMGTGTKFMINGQQMASGDWNNLGLQDVQPTYRWIINSSGGKLTPIVSHTDAYYGGTSLLFRGNLQAVNDIKLYQTELAVAADSKFKIALKPGQADPMLKIAVSFTDAPNTVTYLDIPAGLDPSKWNTVTLDLGAYAGKTIAHIGLRVGNGTSPTIFNYTLRIGQLAVYRGEQDAPNAPTNLTVDAEADIGKAGAASNTAALPLRLHWDRSTSPTYQYNVYRKNLNGSLSFLGATPADAYFVPGVTRQGSENFVTLELEAVGMEFGHSQHTTKSFYVDWSRPAQTLNWQGDGLNNGGDGIWDDNALKWRSTQNVPANQFWSNRQNDTARFAGTGGSISVATPVSVGGLSFVGDGYVLSGNPITLTGSGVVDVASNVSAYINSPFAGSVGLKKTGDGELTIGSPGTFSGNASFTGGVVHLSANNALPTSAAITLDQVTLDLRAIAQTSAGLSLAGDSVIQFGGTGDSGSVLSLASIGSLNGTVQLTNWDGSLSGNGGDRLIFSSLAAAQALAANATFLNPAGLAAGTYSAGVVTLSDGRAEVVPVPEPRIAAWTAAAGLLAVRRRSGR